MATKKKAANTAEVVAKTATEPKFTVEKLRENCRQLFGVSTSTFAGATYGMTGKYTVAQMKAHIEAWGKEGAK